MADLGQKELHERLDKLNAEGYREWDRIQFMRDTVRTLLRGNAQYASGSEARAEKLAVELYTFAAQLWRVEQVHAAKARELDAEREALALKVRGL